jgi:hypothetical protein
MAITATDILFKYSVLTGAAGNSTAGTAGGSLGKYISTTAITTSTLNNLFDDVTGDENAAADVEYRCFFIHNAHATLTLKNTVIWLSAEVAGGTNTAISVDTTVASVIGDSVAQAKQVADESTAPGTQTFSAPTTKGTGLALGDIAPGYCRAVWVERTATDSAALSNDGVTLRVEGDTEA